MPADEIAELIARAAATPETASDRRGRERALAALVPPLLRSAKAAGFRAVAAGRWLVELVIELALHVPVRDAPTLRRQNPDLTDVQIAQLLVKRATKATAGLGAAAGAVAAIEFAAPPTLLATPAQLAAEMLTVTAVELKLVAELHEILGRPAQGSATDRGRTYLMSWVHRRAADGAPAAAGLGPLFGTAARRELRVQVLRRLGRSTTTLAPFLAGAVAGAEVNRRATRALGEAVMSDLRGQDRERWFRQLRAPDELAR